MTQLNSHPDDGGDEAIAPAPAVGSASGAVIAGAAPPKQYEALLGKLAQAERDFADGATPANTGRRCVPLEEASAIVFDLLYSLDFKHGGELVPRLAALYGYIANELLNVGRTRDRVQLGHLRDMIATLQQSWFGQNAA